MLQTLGLAAGLLAAASYIPYFRDILGRRAKPERASWLIWVVLSLIALSAQFAVGATNSLWFTALDTVGTLATFILSIKFGVGGLTRRDLTALIAAGIGLVLWYFTRHAAVALLITIAIDAVGAGLTVAKTWEDPRSETYTMWTVVTIAGLMGAVAVGRLDPILLVYPLYISLANAAVVVAIYFGRRR